jgi:hypothetical protein
MKPFKTKVRGTTTKKELKGGNKDYEKRYISVPIKNLPQVDTPVLVSDPSLLESFVLFYKGYTKALQNEGIEFRNIIRKYFSMQDTKKINEVAKDVI